MLALLLASSYTGRPPLGYSSRLSLPLGLFGTGLEKIYGVLSDTDGVIDGGIV